MEQSVEPFGNKIGKRAAFLMLLSHVHEHLGQSSAYARPNKVTPPWTAVHQQAMEEQAIVEERRVYPARRPRGG